MLLQDVPSILKPVLLYCKITKSYAFFYLEMIFFRFFLLFGEEKFVLYDDNIKIKLLSKEVRISFSFRIYI